MAAPKGTRPPGGSRKGIPNKLTADVRAMILAALDDAGGEEYLVQQARDNPKAFMSLLGRLMPTQVVGKDDTPLSAELSTAEIEKRLMAKLLAVGMSMEQAEALLHDRSALH